MPLYVLAKITLSLTIASLFDELSSSFNVKLNCNLFNGMSSACSEIFSHLLSVTFFFEASNFTVLSRFFSANVKTFLRPVVCGLPYYAALVCAVIKFS